MDRRTLGFLALTGGTALAITGAVVYSRRRGAALGRSDLGRSKREKKPRAIETRKKGGMTTTHYRTEAMPIRQRVGILQDLTHESIKDPEMRKLALRITRHCPERDGKCEAKAIYDWMKKNIRYTGDIGPHKLGRNGPVEGIDLFQHAARTIEFGGGDCDDHSIVGCTLAAHNGLTCRYRVTGPRKSLKDDDFTHIYPIIGLPKNTPRRWIAIDTTLPGRSNFGQEAAHAKRKDFAA